MTTKVKEIEGLHIPHLNENTYELTEALWNSYRHEYCHNYGSLEDATGKTKNELKELLEPFKRLGLVKSVRGLRDEEGQVAGSGFWVNGYGAYQALELALYRYNYNDRPFGKPEDYVPKVLQVGEFTYRLSNPTQS